MVREQTSGSDGEMKMVDKALIEKLKELREAGGADNQKEAINPFLVISDGHSNSWKMVF